MFPALADRARDPLSNLYGGYRISFPAVKWPGRGVEHLPPIQRLCAFVACYRRNLHYRLPHYSYSVIPLCVWLLWMEFPGIFVSRFYDLLPCISVSVTFQQKPSHCFRSRVIWTFLPYFKWNVFSWIWFISVTSALCFVSNLFLLKEITHFQVHFNMWTTSI